MEHCRRPTAGNDHLRKRSVSLHWHRLSVVAGRNYYYKRCPRKHPGILFGAVAPGLATSLPSESPGFYAALQAIERLDLRAVEIPVSIYPVSGLDLEALRSALDQHPIRACWFMPNFQNPTGTSLSTEKKRASGRMLREKRSPPYRRRRLQVRFSRDLPLARKRSTRRGL